MDYSGAPKKSRSTPESSNRRQIRYSNTYSDSFIMKMIPRFQPVRVTKEVGHGFHNKRIRQIFIRKVYVLIMIELILTFTVSAYFMYTPAARSFLLTYWTFILILGFAISGFTLCSMTCCQSIRRSFPLNYLLLIVFTVAKGLMIVVPVIHSEEETVILTALITGVVFFSLMLFAFQSAVDFKGAGPYLLCILLITFLVGVIMTFLPSTNLTILISCALGVLLFAFFVILGTNLMMADNYQFKLSPDDYVFVALSLYLDVVNFFFFTITVLHACFYR